MSDAGKKGWTAKWAFLEQEGNIGIDYCINPHLYPRIFSRIHDDVKIVDFGAGTGILALQILLGFKQTNPGLQAVNDLEMKRQNIKAFLSLEQSWELVKKGKRYLDDLGNPGQLDIKQYEENVDATPPVKEIDFAVSRNFIMHLSLMELKHHLETLSHILKPGGKYFLVTLNPDYELRKAGKPLQNDERYAYSHGKAGEYGEFYHHYKDLTLLKKLFANHFVIEEEVRCVPVTDVFKESHARYYDAEVPIALLFILKKK